MRPQAAGGPTERAPTDLTGRGALLRHLSGEGLAAGSPGRGFTPAPLRDAQRDRASPTANKRGDWSAGLRPASRGSAKPGTAARRAARSRIANREQARGLERRSPTGIARERETRADDTALCPRECRSLSPHRSPRIGCRDHSPLRIRRSVIQWFKRPGKGYQTRINRVLETYVQAQRDAERRRVK